MECAVMSMATSMSPAGAKAPSPKSRLQGKYSWKSSLPARIVRTSPLVARMVAPAMSPSPTVAMLKHSASVALAALGNSFNVECITVNQALCYTLTTAIFILLISRVSRHQAADDEELL